MTYFQFKLVFPTLLKLLALTLKNVLSVILVELG